MFRGDYSKINTCTMQRKEEIFIICESHNFFPFALTFKHGKKCCCEKVSFVVEKKCWSFSVEKRKKRFPNEEVTLSRVLTLVEGHR